MSSSQDIPKIFDDVFEVPTVHYSGDGKFYKPDYQTAISKQDLKKPELNSALLELAGAFTDLQGEGVVPDALLIEDGTSARTRTVIWCDVRERAVKSHKESLKNFTCTCQTNGLVSITYGAVKIIFNPDKYHGVTLESVRIKKTIVFLDEKSNQYRYVDVPLKAKYLALLDDSVQMSHPVEKGDAIGRHVEYSVKLKGRNDQAKFLIPVMKTPADINNGRDIRRGTMLLWPNFKKTNWKAYFMYCDIEDSENTLSFAPVLEKKEGSKLLWDVLPPVPQGRAQAINIKKEGYPRYLIVSEKVKGEELGFFTITLEEKSVRESEESWGIDFGTQGSVIAFSPCDGKAPLPFFLRKDYSYMILEGKPERQKAIRDDVRWFPTYPSEDNAEGEPYVLTQLAADNEQRINSIYGNEDTIPVEHYNIVSLHADTDAISKRLITDLKWPGTITLEEMEGEFIGRRNARKGYLTLLLMMSLAERIYHDPEQHSPAVIKINPMISYPLRMGTSDVVAYADDFRKVCNRVSDLTGFNFGTIKTISESRAASIISVRNKETVIADLGGGTLDLWMGCDSNDKAYEISTDSIRLGGLNLISEVSQNSLFMEHKDLMKLGKMYLRENPQLVGSRISLHYGALKKVYSYYSNLVNEYITRFILGHLMKNNKIEKAEVHFITVGNGWKIFSCYGGDIENINKWVVDDVNERAKRLIKEFSLPVSASVEPWAYNEKKEVAIGAAISYLRTPALSKSDKISSTAGIEFDFRDANNVDCHAKWTSRIPFPFSVLNRYQKDYIAVSPILKDGCYAILPEFPFWEGQVTKNILKNFNAALNAATDTRVYDADIKNINLQVSPFGILCEKILNSFRDKKNW